MKPSLKTITKISAIFLAASFFFVGPVVAERTLTLSYFMGPKHPMNKAVFTPFAKKLAEVSGGKLKVKQFPGGVLNSSPPKQYATLLEGVADVAFALPGYTAQLFPITNVVTVPNVASTAVEGTEALWRAYDLIEKEYNAKILAIWANGPPVLLTKNKAVRSLEDLKGMKVRVTSRTDVPFMEAMGASAISQPVTVINRNLQNGTIDAIAIDPSAIGSFKLWEPANYLTIGLPGSSSAFILLMNKEVWNGLSAQEKAWVNQASGEALSMNGGTQYQAAGKRGLDLARKKKVEIIESSDAEKSKFNAAIQEEMKKFRIICALIIPFI